MPSVTVNENGCNFKMQLNTRSENVANQTISTTLKMTTKPEMAAKTQVPTSVKAVVETIVKYTMLPDFYFIFITREEITAVESIVCKCPALKTVCQNDRIEKSIFEAEMFCILQENA